MTEANNPQYAPGQTLFGFSLPDSTGAEGSHTGGSDPYAAYSNGEVGGAHLDGHDLGNTGAPGSAPHQPPSDGGNVSGVTSPFGYLDGTDAAKLSGTTDTSKSAVVDPFTHNGTDSTGAGQGTPTHTDAGGADQSSPWKNV